MNLESGIRRRTRSGRDVNMKAFKPYSKAYAQYKKDSGRSGKVDLTNKDHMLPAITAKNIDNGLRFGFTSNAETKKAAENQKTRLFFGLSKPQIKYLRKVMSKL
jgi:hypothetical protein